VPHGHDVQHLYNLRNFQSSGIFAKTTKFPSDITILIFLVLWFSNPSRDSQLSVVISISSFEAGTSEEIKEEKKGHHLV